MSGQPWYRHNPRDFLDGIVGMGADTIGAYIVCLDLIYARGEAIPNDHRWIGGVLGCSPRAAAALVNRLIDAGKLHLVDGKLSNARASAELENAAKFSRNQAEAGAKGGSKRAENAATVNENNDVAQGSLKPKHNITEQEQKKDTVASQPRRGRASQLPEGVSAELWSDYRAMRQRKRAPMTTKAESLMLAELSRLIGEGHDPTVVIEQSIANSWTGLFEIKDIRNGKRIGPLGQSPSPPTRRSIGREILEECERERLAELRTAGADPFAQGMHRRAGTALSLPSFD